MVVRSSLGLKGALIRKGITDLMHEPRINNAHNEYRNQAIGIVSIQHKISQL